MEGFIFNLSAPPFTFALFTIGRLRIDPLVKPGKQRIAPAFIGQHHQNATQRTGMPGQAALTF